MTAADRDGFLHRWSRRKTQAREGLPQDNATPVDPPEAADAMPLPGAPADTQPEPPPLTLDDVRALTRDSDFAPFVAGRVAPEVKNAALKKLFSDPHYNVMDGLDTYIDDYSCMETLPTATLRRLASARALALFDDEPQPDGPAAAIEASGAPPADAASAPSPDRSPADSPASPQLSDACAEGVGTPVPEPATDPVDAAGPDVQAPHAAARPRPD